MAEFEMHEATTKLSKLVERAEAGEDILITRHGRPVARLVSERSGKGFASLAGVWEGRVRIADDFDELPDEVADALGMKS